MSDKNIDVNEIPGVKAMAESYSNWLDTRPFDPRGLINGCRCPNCHSHRVEERAFDSGRGWVYVQCHDCGYDAWVKDQ